MVEPGTYPDPDEPQALTPDSVYVPETGEEIHAPADSGPDAEVQAEEGVAVENAVLEGEAVAEPGALSRAMGVGATVGRGAMHGAGLVWAYPRAAVATGLSVLVLCGVLSLKSRRAPELKLPTPESSTAKVEESTEPPAPTKEAKVTEPVPNEEPEKVVAPAPVVPSDELAIPSPAPASGDGVEQTVADLDAPDLPPELDAKAAEADSDDDPLGPAIGMASSLLAFNDPKPEDAPAPAPAPAAQAPIIAPPKGESAPTPTPAPTPAAELPPETTAAAQPPAPSPAADLPAVATPAPAATADLPPVVAPTEPAPSPPLSPASDPTPLDDPLDPGQASPASPPQAPTEPAPSAPPSTLPVLPEHVPAAQPEQTVAPIVPEKPAASTPPPATLPQATAADDLPAFEPTPVSKPAAPVAAAAAMPDGDWLPLKHNPGTPKLDSGEMDLTDEGFDELAGRGEAFFRDSPPPSNPLPVRVGGAAGAAAATVAASTGAAALAADARTATRRDEGRMDTILHKVQPGENFWTISRTHYASGRYYKALGKANSDQFQRLQDLYVGAVIRIPPPEDLDAALIEPPGGRSARNVDPDSAESPAPQTASADTTRLRRTRRLDGELNLPVSDPDAAQVSDRDDRRRSPREEYEEPAPRRAAPVHKVRSRETLRSIARDRLGDSRRAREILDLNRDAIPDPARLPVGQVLDLPDDAE